MNDMFINLIKRSFENDRFPTVTSLSGVDPTNLSFFGTFICSFTLGVPY